MSQSKVGELRAAYRPFVDRTKKEVFQKLPLESAVSRKLNEIAVYVFTKQALPRRTAGVVVAGYGSRDFFPTVEEFRVEGVFHDTLKFSRERSSAVGKNITSAIIPFAPVRNRPTRLCTGVVSGISGVAWRNPFVQFWTRIEILYSNCSKGELACADSSPSRIIQGKRGCREWSRVGYGGFSASWYWASRSQITGVADIGPYTDGKYRVSAWLVAKA